MEEEIVVTGVRDQLRVPAERILNRDDLAAYGLGTIGELVGEVAAENGEQSDEPVFLVNGERSADLDDVEDFPVEAVSRLEILPTGSASRVGASPNRRIYNIILRRRVDAVVVGLGARAATEGGWNGKRGEVSYSRIRSDRRLNFAARVNSESRLLESERDIDQVPGSIPDAGRFRSLRPELQNFSLKSSVADRLAPWLTFSGSGKFSRSTRESLLGPANVLIFAEPFAIEQDGRTGTGSLNLSFNADVGSWLISLLGTYDRERRRTRTDRQDDDGLPNLPNSQTESVTKAVNAEILAAGPLVELPSGSLRATFGAGFSRDSVNGSQDILGVRTSDEYVQWSRNLSGGLEVPIASRVHGFLPALGELSLGAQLDLFDVSDFGSFANRTLSLQWQPAAWIRLFGSLTSGKTPPAVGYVADPVLETPGVPYFDPLRGENVNILEISGGNPDLGPQRGESRRLSVNAQPIRSLPIQLFADYRAIRNRDVITALPPASDLIFSAFPDRFVRSPDGTLTVVDIRPVSFSRQNEQQIRYGFNLTVPLGAGHSPEAADETRKDVLQGGTRPERSARPRLQVFAAHTWLFDSELEIAPGINPVDLLTRDAVGFGGATRPRHQLEFTLGYAQRGLGVRLNGQHRGVSYLNLVDDVGSDSLRFSPMTLFNLRAFLEGQRIFPRSGWLRSSRLTLSVLNLTNQRPRIRDTEGSTPLAYQPAYRDPLGRTIEVRFRKLF